MGAHFKIRTEKTGHYVTHGTPGPGTRYVWIVLHGYGQLAGSFIRKFEWLDPDVHYVIAPEGLNRFYFEGLQERPIASWMTRLNRLDEIADYVLFLERLRAGIGWERFPGVQIMLLGFSQGVSSLLRWMHNAHPRIDQLVLWAGGLPDDADFSASEAYFSQIPCTFMLGDQDPYISVDQARQRMTKALPGRLQPRLVIYPGDHRVSEAPLREWLASTQEG